MHAGLAALADETTRGPPGATLFASLVARVKAAATNREAIRLAVGRQVILARGFVDPRSFSKPAAQEQALTRIRANFAHYRSLCASPMTAAELKKLAPWQRPADPAPAVVLTFISPSRGADGILFMVVLVYTVLSSPLLLLGLSVLAGAWAYCFILTKPEDPVTIAGYELRRREKVRHSALRRRRADSLFALPAREVPLTASGLPSPPFPGSFSLSHHSRSSW